MSLPSFCQTGITTNNYYEVIGVPKHIMAKMVKDIKEGDIAKEEVKVLTEQATYQQQYIATTDSINALLKLQFSNCESVLEQKDKYLQSINLQLQKTEKKVGNQKGWMKGLTIALTISAILFVAK